jgi:hypothetical protein
VSKPKYKIGDTVYLLIGREEYAGKIVSVDTELVTGVPTSEVVYLLQLHHGGHVARHESQLSATRRVEITQ